MAPERDGLDLSLLSQNEKFCLEKMKKLGEATVWKRVLRAIPPILNLSKGQFFP
jgi:hypothetical protein